MALDWFRSYLSDRYQCALVHGVSSSHTGVSHGVPHGSVLRPFHFVHASLRSHYWAACNKLSLLC